MRAARLLVCLVLLLPCSASAASLRDRLRASSLTVGIAGGSAFDALAGEDAEYGALLVVARPEADPVPALRERAAGVRLPGDA